MPNRKLVPANYKKLLSEIVGLYEGARKALVEAYWRIGQRIVEVEQDGAVKAAYGSGLLQKISEDLSEKLGSGFSLRNVERMRVFYLQNRNSAPAPKLSLAHHFALLPIRDKTKRMRLQARAIREGLKRNALRALVHAELVREEVAQNQAPWEESGSPTSDSRSQRGVALLMPQRGMLYTYRIVQPKLVGAEASELLIDIGFSSYKDLDNITGKNFAPGTLVESVKDADGRYTLKETRSSISKTGSQRGEASLFTYVAEVEKVVDGDTLRVVVDLGFGIKTRQYLRLRGIDCPEMDTPEGKKAAEFIRSRIKQAGQIILTSSKSDKYDRYLADVFYTDEEGKEIYLNNLILENGYAVRMGD